MIGPHFGTTLLMGGYVGSFPIVKMTSCSNKPKAKSVQTSSVIVSFSTPAEVLGLLYFI